MSTLHRCPQCDSEIPPSAPAGLCPRCLLLAANESQVVEPSGLGPTKLTPPECRFTPPTVPELASLFPQLEIQELLGRGGMGAVYRARQPGLDRLVAVKILPPGISSDSQFTERFQREARALARLNHPNIVTVYDFGKAGGLCYILMEFVDGANLRQVISKQSLTAAESLTIVPQICEALQYAHDEGVVHRDIKPENVLIDKRGRVKIADFGLAKLMDSEASEPALTATQQVMGTLRYMAPEQMQGSREVDHRADIYSLGVVFYELLTGELPVGKFAPPSKKVQIDVRLDEVVLRALEQEPNQRYQQASEVKTDIESISHSPSQSDSQRGGPHLEMPPIKPIVSPEIRRQLLGPAIALLLFGLALFFPAVLCFLNGLDIADGNDGTAAEVGFGLIVLSGGIVVLAGLVLRGGWHLLAVENYRAAILGSFLAPPVGLWGMLVLSRPEVKAAFPQAAIDDPPGPRHSPHAFWGAIWAGAGLIAAVCLLTAGSVTSVREVRVATQDGQATIVADAPNRDVSGWIWLIVIPFSAAAVSAPIGATVLGAMAVAQVQRSNGKLYGLRLAFADAVFYPLLLLGIVIFALTHITQIVIWAQVHSGFLPTVDRFWDILSDRAPARPNAMFLILDVIVTITVCMLAGVSAWRKVARRPPARATTSPAVPAFVGSPLTQVRFILDDSQDITRRAIFHFSALGYQLTDQQAEVCVFHRGSKWAGLWCTDIREMHTRLTVRTADAGSGRLWVSCDWSARTLGSWITRHDISALEAEGRGLESLLTGQLPADQAPARAPVENDSPATARPRPRLIPLIATLNLAASVILLLVGAMEQPSSVTQPVPRLWQVWERMDVILSFALATGLFAASIALFLWMPWARRVTLAVCVFGLAAFVFDAPYLARFVIPDFYAEVQQTLVAEGANPEMQEIGAISTVFGSMILPMALGLIWLVGQLVYFTRPQVAAAFESPNDNPSRIVEWLFSGMGAIVGVLCVFGPLLLLLGLTALFDKTPSSSATIADSIPRLGTITSGIGAEFTVPAGHVAVLEVVTRRNNETVPVHPHCGYVMAPPERDVSGVFHWSRKRDITTEVETAPSWSLEILTSGGGRGYTEAKLLPETLNAIVGAMSFALGRLEPNEEVIHWGSADANNLPSDGLIGLRVTVVPHGMQSGGSGNAHIDWRKAHSSTSTSRRKLREAAP